MHKPPAGMPERGFAGPALQVQTDGKHFAEVPREPRLESVLIDYFHNALSYDNIIDVIVQHLVG